LSGTVAFLINFVRIVTPHRFTWASATMLDSDRNWKQILDAEKEAKVAQ
jgi:hypothetical protein